MDDENASGSPVDVVTGAFGYTGRHIAKLLLESGRTVRTITAHPDRPSPFGARVAAAPLRFDDERALAETLRGAHTLYNTYWVRFPHGETTYERAVENTSTLLRAARRARIRRLVHVSIVHASENSELPYFRAKGIVEREIRASRLSYAIVRPTVLFGGGDVLINNIAWVVRRFPVFAVPGSGDYGIQPVYVGDLARLCVEAAAPDKPVTLDACGPESFGYAELVRLIARAVGRRLRLVHVSPRLALRLASVIGGCVGDVLLTPDELAGLVQGVLTSDGPPTGRTSFARWLEDHGPRLGLTYASELDRHYR